jgi:hypothetical protein
MKQFQKIAIGLLGLSNPEMFIPRREDNASPPSKLPGSDDIGVPFGSRKGRGAQLLRAFKFVIAALAIGSRTVPLADNSQLLRDLRTRARLLYGTDPRHC